VRVGVGGIIVVVIGVGTDGVESSALTWLTLNCRMGQNIKIAIINMIEEKNNMTPRENLNRDCGWGASSSCDLQS